MKAFTHPHLTTTLIFRKDGSTYAKNWLYFRPTLIVEEQPKIWEKSKNRKNINYFDFNTKALGNASNNASTKSKTSY